MILPQFADRFEGDNGIDAGREEIDAVFPDGERRRVVLRIGTPWQRDGRTWLRCELENLDRTDGPFMGTGSIFDLVLAVRFIVGRLDIFAKKHGCVYYFPNSEERFDHLRFFAIPRTTEDAKP
jgi:hypothetical protein